MTETSDYLPHLVYDAEQVGALDSRFINEFGVEGFSLMQRAARAAYDELAQNWPMPGRLVVLCGPGNNGGDGALVARQAMQAGWQVTLVAPLDLSKASGDAARAFEAYREAGGEMREFVDEPIQADLIIDALFGTGLNREVTGPMAQAIDRINEASGRGVGVLSIDIASGVDAGTGRTWGRAVVADTTVTFIGLKLGLLTGDGAAHCGELAFDDLGAPDALYEGQPHVARRITHRDLRHVLPVRPRGVHKGDNGHVLCIGGGRGMGGAIRMSAESALRAGAGLVSVACHHDHAGAMSQARPELMCQGLPDELERSRRQFASGYADRRRIADCDRAGARARRVGRRAVATGTRIGSAAGGGCRRPQPAGANRMWIARTGFLRRTPARPPGCSDGRRPMWWPIASGPRGAWPSATARWSRSRVRARSSPRRTSSGCVPRATPAWRWVAWAICSPVSLPVSSPRA